MGRPLISYIIEAAVKSNVFDAVYVNSEHPIFEEIALKYGASFYLRDPKFSTDETINDTFLLDFINNVESEVCYQLLPTSPLIDAHTIQQFVANMEQGNFDTLISVTRHQIAALMGTTALNFSPQEPHRSSQEMNPIFTYATVLMGWKTAHFSHSMETIGSGYHGGTGKTGYFEINGPATIDVDEEADFQLAELALQARASQENTPPQYYGESKDLNSEVDVPSILARDGIEQNDFDSENQRVTNIDELIAKKDSSKSWSHRVINTASNSATVISQLPGEGNRLHYHPNWNEWWYILRGQWKWTVDGQDQVIQAGEVVFIPKGIWHKITAIGDAPAVRLAVSRADVPHIYDPNHPQ